MTRVGLTATQQRLLDFVRAELAAGRPAPSYDEMLPVMGLRSKSGIHRLVHGIVERGHLVHLPNRARALALPAAGPATRPAELISHANPAPALALSKALADRVRAYCARKCIPPREMVTVALILHMRRNP